MKRKLRFLIVLCAFIFTCPYSPNASANDCLLGTVWRPHAIFPYLFYWDIPLELCFNHDGTFALCDPEDLVGILWTTGTIYSNVICMGDRTIVYDTWLRGTDGLLLDLWVYLKVLILRGDTLVFGWGIVPGGPFLQFILAHGVRNDVCVCPTECLDNDRDGYGSPASVVCTYPEEDCDDLDPGVNPSATEGPEGDPTCSDGMDNNCDGSIDHDDVCCSGLVVYFPDPDLEAAIRLSISKPEGDILACDLKGVTWLNAVEEGISELSGMEYCTGLTKLWLRDNQILDVSPLGGLVNLHLLSLANNQVSDVSPLAGLTSLDTLWLHNNQISDILPLVNNTGIGSGDMVQLVGNPLSSTSCTVYIPELESRAVTVYHDCP